MNEGARLLKASPLSLTQIGAIAGVTKQAVSKWASGAKKPGPEARAKLTKLVPLEAWDQEAGAPNGKPPAVPVAPPIGTFQVPVPAFAQQVNEPMQDDYAAPDFSADDIGETELQAQCERLRRDVAVARGEVGGKRPADAKTIKELESEYRKAVKELGTFRRELSAVDESKLTKTATFARYAQRVVDAVADMPEARARLIEALSAD